MSSWIGFQLVKEISNDENLREGLILPGVIITKLSTYCCSIKLLDSRNREYKVEIDEHTEDHFFKVGSGEWPLFYRRAIGIDRDISMLCLRLVGPDVFKVMCFRSDGMEVGYHTTNQILVEPSLTNRCLIKGSGSTYDKQLLPESFLRELQKPNLYARLIGCKQNATVDVLYNRRIGNEKAKEAGFQGAQWSLFCSENNIDEECTMLFTRLMGNKFYVDVFNSEGVGIGVTVDKGNEELLNNPVDHGVSSGSQGAVFKSFDGDSDDEVVLKSKDHRCRVSSHEHTEGLPNFLIKFQSHSLSSKMLTFPKSFVKEHELHQYRTALLNFGELNFTASLVIRKDNRNEADLNHLVCMYDWELFLEETGICVGEVLMFEMEWKEDSGSNVYFNVC